MIGSRAAARGCAWWQRSTTRPGRCSRGRTSSSRSVPRATCASCAMVATHGVPWSIYMDQHGALKRNDDHWTLAEELRGAQDPTQVGQALQALGIEAIYALSPQAKGRVERLWGTRQDRLVSELRLARAATAAAAHAVPAQYRPGHNRRFAIPAQNQTPAWR